MEQTEALARLSERIESGDIDHDDAADISTLTAALKQRDEQIAALQRRVAELNQENNQRATKLVALQQRIGELENALQKIKDNWGKNGYGGAYGIAAAALSPAATEKENK